MSDEHDSPTNRGEEPTLDTDAREAETGRILNDFLDTRARGESVSEHELFARYPEFANELREHLAMVREVAGTPGLGHAEGAGAMDATLDVRGGVQPSLASLPQDSFTGYEIIREIHRGGQGVVYQAIQKSTKRRVAIKVMREGPFAGQRDKARFEREVHILGALNHPNIVAIHDSGVASGHHYFVMDYISGQPLEVWMASGERSIEETLKLFAKICAAVNAAHLKGVIHRDLKPGNIRIDNQGEPHVLDFGLAKMATGEVTNSSRPQVMTVTGQFVGSLPWASPEQAEGAPDKIDPRTDVYSLGVILYQMLTSKFPYEVIGNMRDVLDRILKSEPARPSTIRRQINDEVETIVLKCLSKERERRYQTAGELTRDIGHYLAGEPIDAKRDSGAYLLKKKLKRYKVPVAIASGFMLFVTLAAITFLVMARENKRLATAAGIAARKAETAATQASAARDQTQDHKTEADLLRRHPLAETPRREVAAATARREAAAAAVSMLRSEDPDVESATFTRTAVATPNLVAQLQEWRSKLESQLNSKSAHPGDPIPLKPADAEEYLAQIARLKWGLVESTTPEPALVPTTRGFARRIWLANLRDVRVVPTRFIEYFWGSGQLYAFLFEADYVPEGDGLQGGDIIKVTCIKVADITPELLQQLKDDPKAAAKTLLDPVVKKAAELGFFTTPAASGSFGLVICPDGPLLGARLPGATFSEAKIQSPLSVLLKKSPEPTYAKALPPVITRLDQLSGADYAYHRTAIWSVFALRLAAPDLDTDKTMQLWRDQFEQMLPKDARPTIRESFAP